MKYSCDDFVEVKSEKGKLCSVGKFGKHIYAMRVFVADGHHSYHDEYYRVTEKEFSEYPINAETLISTYYKGQTSFLCSNYLGKNHQTYRFEA